MKLIVGLGNPGKEYENTRHNIGYMVIDSLAKDCVWKEKWHSLYTELNIQNEKILLVKPLTYMNLSGDVIIKYVNYFKIDISDILIIHDDMDLEIGTYKIRYKGGPGGHNGLKNIENNLKTDEYKRIKIGISKNNIDMIDYVLGKFSSDELAKLNPVIKIIPDIIDDFVSLSFENLMNKYN